MRRATIIAALALFAFVSSGVYAQSGMTLGIGGGLSLLQKPEGVKEFWKDGFMGGVDLGFGGGFLGLRGLFEYSVCGLETDKFQEMLGDDYAGVDISGGSLKIMAAYAMLDVHIIPAETGISPYATAGVGFMKFDLSDVEVSYQGRTESAEIGAGESGFSLTFGAGMDIKFSPKAALFVEGRWSVAFFGDEDGDDVGDEVGQPNVNEEDLGGDFTYIPIKAGFRFFF
jgi:opacity protein-like surface antigen